MIIPLLGPVDTNLPETAGAWIAAVTGGASAVATSGFDSIGGGGPFWVGAGNTPGAGVVD